MCTIIALHRVHPTFPLVIAANRDEFYARGATGPELLADDPPVVGGRDVSGGGTWMGVTAAGLFVGLTNQRTFAAGQPGLRSRGEVVLDALRSGTVARVERYLRRLDAREFNPFNLLFGAGGELRVAYARRDQARVEVHAVAPGVHVLPNDTLDSHSFPKVARARLLTEPAVAAPLGDLVPALRRALADHALPPRDLLPEPPAGAAMTGAIAHQLAALCVHTPVYGTRSSTIVALEPGRVAAYHFADGPPCRAGFLDAASMLARA